MKAEQLRKSILQLAIQGKLVPQDPNDEPASVLLERIRAEKQRLIKEGKIKKDKNDSVIFKGDDNRYYEKMGSEVKDITDDLPFEIPDSWVWTGLGKLITIISGVSYDKKDVNGNIILDSVCPLQFGCAVAIVPSLSCIQYNELSIKYFKYWAES